MSWLKMPGFLRRYVRRRMHPMAPDRAWNIKKKLSYVYMFVAWNAGGYVLYQIFSGNKRPSSGGVLKRSDDMTPPSVYYAELLGVPKAEVIRVSGLSVRKTTIDKTDDVEGVEGQEVANLQ